MVEMRFKIWLKRVPMLNQILIEEIGRSDDEITAQKSKFGVQNIDIVYSFICEMCSENETAINDASPNALSNRPTLIDLTRLKATSDRLIQLKYQTSSS